MRYSLRKKFPPVSHPNLWQLEDIATGQIWESDLDTLASTDLGIPSDDPVYGLLAEAAERVAAVKVGL